MMTIIICIIIGISSIIVTYATHPPRAAPTSVARRHRTCFREHVGDSNHTVRGYCLDIPRFEESLNN